MKTKRGRKRPAFTLAEMVIVVGLMSILLVLSTSNFYKVRGKSGAQGLSMTVLEEFRRVRQEAVAHRRPTALVFPTANGTKPSTSAFYVMEGETVPRVIRSVDYYGEYAGATAYVGHWPGQTFVAGIPTATSSKWDNFDVAAWLSSKDAKDAGYNCQNDFAYVFLPDGSLRTNSLPAFDNAYHVLIASGVSYSGTGSTSTLTASGEAFTICLSNIGGIDAVGGIQGQDGSIAANGSLGTAHSTATPPGLTTNTTRAPEDATAVGSVPTIYPPPGVILDPNVDAYVRPNQFVTLEMRCNSPSGDELFCSYTVTIDHTTNKGTGSGIFSRPGSNGGMIKDDDDHYSAPGGRMEWDQAAGNWKSVWQWAPPADARAGDLYTVNPLVANKRTGVPRNIGIAKTIRVVKPGKILYEKDGTAIWSMDEAGNRKALYRNNAAQPSASLDGARMAWVRGGNIWLSLREDPSADVALTTSGGCSNPCLSPSGNWIAFRRSDMIYVMKTMPEGPGNAVVTVDNAITHTGGAKYFRDDNEKYCWSPQGDKLVYPWAGPGSGDTDTGALCYKEFAIGSAGPPAPGVRKVLCPANRFPGIESPWMSSSWGVDGLNTIFASENWNDTSMAPPANYRPYAFRFPADLTSNSNPTNPYWWADARVEETLVERNPHGGNTFLECVAPVSGGTPGTRQIIKINSDAIPTGIAPGTGWLTLPNATTAPALTQTSDGSCLRPVWSQ